jgi:aspartyl protease family protein
MRRVFGLAVTAVSVAFLMGLDAERAMEARQASETNSQVPILYAFTELKADSRGHFLVDAEIDGTTVKAMVDTGASAVALSYEDADNAGLRPRSLEYNIPISTANGVVNAARVSLRRVEVDGVEVRDVEGLVLPEGAFNGTLLGMSFLSRLRSFKVEDGVLYLED